MNKYLSYAFAVFVLVSITGFLAYPQLPETVPTHWNAAGEIDGYSGRGTAALLFPGLLLFIIALFALIPKIEVFKQNLKDFEGAYYGFAFVLSVFFAYVYALTLASAFGYGVPMNVAMIPALSLIFYFGGGLMKASKRTFFVGARTPWTLANDEVWRKTNDATGSIMQAFAIVFLLGLFFQPVSFALIIAGAVATAVFPFVYSYAEYRKIEERKGGAANELARKPKRKARR